MKRTLLLPILAVSATALAQSPMDVARKAAAEYQRATLKKDFTSFEKTSTPDFVYIDGTGRKAGKAQAMAGMKGFYGMMTIKRAKVTAVSARATPGRVIYIQESWTDGSMKMGGPKPTEFTGYSKDEVTMAKVGGKWLTKQVKNLKSDQKLDGKKASGM